MPEPGSLSSPQEPLSLRMAGSFHHHRKSQAGKGLWNGPYLNMFSYLHSERSPQSIHSDGTRLRRSHKCAGSRVYPKHIYPELPEERPRGEF